MPLKRVDFEDSDVRQLPGPPPHHAAQTGTAGFSQVSARPCGSGLSAGLAGGRCSGTRRWPVSARWSAAKPHGAPSTGEHLLANELDDAQKRSLMAAIDELKELHHNGGCPCSVTAPDGKPVEYTFFRPQQYGAIVYYPGSGRPSTRCWRATMPRRTAPSGCAPRARSVQGRAQGQ